MEDDKTKIFAAIRQLLPRGFLDLENLVKERLREWTMEAAEEALAAALAVARTAAAVLALLRSTRLRSHRRSCCSPMNFTTS